MKKKLFKNCLLIILPLIFCISVFLCITDALVKRNNLVASADSTVNQEDKKLTSIADWKNTTLNGAKIINSDNEYLQTNVYETGVDNGFDVSSATKHNVLKNGLPFASFYIDTLGDGGEVLKGAKRYGNVDAYGFVAGSGENVYRTNENGKEDLVGKNSIAIKLKYNYTSLDNLTGTDGRSWSINDDTWKQSVNGISSVGPIGKGAVIVQKFVPSANKEFPTQKSDWYRLNQYSDRETAGLHTVNFFHEFDPGSGKDRIPVYIPDGDDLEKGIFVKITVAYELVHSEPNSWIEGFFTGEWDDYTYKNVVEETTFYLCNTSGEIVFQNLYYASNDNPSQEPPKQETENTTEVTKTAGEIVENQGSSEGFRLETRGDSYDIKYYFNDSSNAHSCKDGEVFNIPGKYEFVVTTKIGVVRKKTVYVHEDSIEKNVEVYFGDGLVSKDSKTIFSPSDNYPVYVKNTVTLKTEDENRTSTKHAPLIGKLFLLNGDWEKIERDENELPLVELITEKSASQKNWEFSKLPVGNYEAVFANNEDFFNGTATGDTYKFVWRFSIVEEGLLPVVNEELLYQQIGVSDYASLHYEVPLNTEGNGKVIVCFSNEIEAYNFANEYLVSQVKFENGEYLFNDKKYTSEREMLADLHKRAKEVVKKSYFDLTDEKTYTTLKYNNVRPSEPNDNSTQEDKDNYANFKSILKRNLTQDVYIFSNQSYENSVIGEPFLNDRKFVCYDLDTNLIEPGINSLHFISLGDYESKTVTLYNDQNKKYYSVPYGVAVENYLVLQNAPSGRYKIIETNETGTTEYEAVYIKKGNITTTLYVERLLNGEVTPHKLNVLDASIRFRANNFILTSAENPYDPYGIIKIKKDGQDFAIYQLDEVENICIDEEGQYEIIAIDRLGNSVTYYVDIYSASKIYTFTLMNNDAVIFTDNAFGGKSFKLDQLQSVDENYEFAGWQDEYGNVYNDSYTFNVPHDVVLTALWHNSNVNISVYDGIEVETYSDKVGAKQVLPKLYRPGYTLYGYRYTQPDGTIRFYKGQINSVPNVASVRLDAVWIKNSTSIQTETGTEQQVLISLVNGDVVDTIISQKSDIVQLPQIANENGMRFAGWLYQYKLSGTIFTTEFNYNEIEEIGIEDANTVKLTAIWLADPDSPNFAVATTVSASGGAGSINSIGGFIADNAIASISVLFALVLVIALFLARKKIYALLMNLRNKLALNKRAVALADGTEEVPVNSQNSVKVKAIKNYRFGGFAPKFNKRSLSKILVTGIICVLCFIMFFEWQNQLFSGIKNEIMISKAEKTVTRLSKLDDENEERRNNVIDAFNGIESSYAFSDNSELSDSETFLYSNVLVDLMSMGYEDVFTANAIIGDKVVSGLGYTAYVDAYEEDGQYIFGAGFVSLSDKNYITKEDAEKGVKIVIDESEIDYYEYTEFKLTFNQAWGPLHYVAYKQYVQYQVADYLIQSTITADDGTYNDALGNVYDYDIEDFCHYVNYDTDFDLNAYGLTSAVDYDTLVATYVERIQEQQRNAVNVNVEKADFISAQALNDYLAHNQDESFLGVDADTILYYEANTTDTQYYTIFADGSIKILELPPDPVKQASIFERIAIGILAIGGAVLGVLACAIPGVGPILGGAILSASIDIFMQVTVCGTAPENIDWVSVACSAAVGAVTGGIGMAANAVTKVAVATAKTVIQQVLAKVAIQAVAGLFSGAASYLISAGIKGEEINFADCVTSMCVGSVTGMLTCLSGVALECITTKSSALMTVMQVLSGAFSGAGSYLLTLMITDGEFNWQDFTLSMAMGATMSAVQVIGGKLLKAGKTALQQRKENAGKTKFKNFEIDSKDPKKQIIEQKLSTKEGLEDVMSKHPDKAAKWKQSLAEINDLLDSGSAADVKKAQLKLSNLKGQVFEYAARDTLAQSGFTVQEGQSAVAGQNGKTFPDIVAKNNSGKTLNLFGYDVAPGETVYVECKCGKAQYIKQQVTSGHLQNQLSGHNGGRSFLVSTSNLNQVDKNFLTAKLPGGTSIVPANISVEDVNNLLLSYAR